MTNAHFKLAFSYVFYFVFALMMFSLLLARSISYDTDGLPKSKNSVERIIGEDIAGDYAVVSLLESKKTPQKAYDAQEQTLFLKNELNTQKTFVSALNPTLALIIVPWKGLGYDSFRTQWFLWGVFLFSVALYTLFPLKKAIGLLFAFPAVLLSFSYGGFGLYYASAFILTLLYCQSKPKLAGFFAGLLCVQPFFFAVIISTLYFRKKFKALIISLLFAVFLAFATVYRYGFFAYQEAFFALARKFFEAPCDFNSVLSVFACQGLALPKAIILQILIAIGVFYYGFGLLKRTACPVFIKNAYICAGTLLIFPFSSVTDLPLLYASIAFLLADCKIRGFAKADKLLIGLGLGLPFIDPVFSALTGTSVDLILVMLILYTCYKRSF